MVRSVTGSVECIEEATEAIYTFLVELDPEKIKEGLLPYQFKSGNSSLDEDTLDDFTNGDMQLQLAELLAARPAAPLSQAQHEDDSRHAFKEGGGAKQSPSGTGRRA